MKRNLILLSMLAMLVGVTSCSVGKSGTENIVFENQTTEYLLKDFTKIDANGIVKIVLKQGSVWNIRVVESNNPNLKTIVKIALSIFITNVGLLVVIFIMVFFKSFAKV